MRINMNLNRQRLSNVGLFVFNYNGNQTLSPNGLTITYNSINQPQQVKSGSTVKQKFAYLADGRKLHSISDPANDGGLAYIGTSVFNIGRGNYTSFESTSFSAGRIVRNSSGAYAVQYHITDHLGSVRAVLNQSMTVLEQNDYYPFGLRHPNASLKTTANRYRYNGKEEIAADATSDYGARQYSAEFCQWLQVDPLAEKYYSWSPYNFCVGNPLRFVDPNGMGWITATYNGETFYFFDSEVNSQQDIINRYYNGDVRDSYDISYLGDSYSFANEDNQYSLNDDGSYSLNGTLCDSEIDNGGLHIGNGKTTDAPNGGKIFDRNLYGVYLGQFNPNDANNKDIPSYAIPPIDQLDYAAYNHDRGYDRKGASGPTDAFTNVSTLPEDLRLVLDCQRIIDNSQSLSNYEVRWAKQTKTLFINISIGKTKRLLRP